MSRPGICQSISLVLVAGALAGSALAEARKAGASVRIVFAGDVMLDGGPGHAASFGQDPFADLAPILRDADIAVCNLECTVAKRGVQVLKPYTFKARPECADLLKRHFSAVCLANNHAGDFGPEGLLEQLTLLDKAGLAYFGGGRDRQEAYRPLILQRNGRRIALLGYNDFPPRQFEAGRRRAGTAWLTEAEATAGIKAARSTAHADIVIPMLHWGEELEPAPEPLQKKLARALIDAGADAVIGGHPHVAQTVDFYNGRPIVYSLGNFVFDYYPGDPEVWTGWVVRLTFTPSKPVEMETFVVELDRSGIPHLLPKPVTAK